MPTETQELVNYVGDKCHAPILMARCNSRSYGFASPTSDDDVRGLHIVLPRQLCSIGKQSAVTVKDHDFISHDFREFASQLYKGNASAIELMLTAQFCFIDHNFTAMDRVMELAQRAVSKRLITQLFGQAMSYMTKLSNGAETDRHKGILHVFRLLLAAKHVLVAENLMFNLPTLISLYPVNGVRVKLVIGQRVNGSYKDEPISDMELDTMLSFANGLMEEVRQLETKSSLREQPDIERVELDDLCYELTMHYDSCHRQGRLPFVKPWVGRPFHPQPVHPPLWTTEGVPPHHPPISVKGTTTGR